MEKENVILNDNELKDVSGGAPLFVEYKDKCNDFKTHAKCAEHINCKWVVDKCILNRG